MNNPFREQFPFYQTPMAANEQKLPVYLDSAATMQKHASALHAMNEYHQLYNANVHRGSYAIAQQATNQYEAARQTAATFLGASRLQEIVFTSGTTEAINIVALGLDKKHISGNEILVSGSEHHANLVPWQMYAKRHNLSIRVMPLEKNGIFTKQTLQHWLSLISDNTAIVACAHVSNALGNIYPVQAICNKAKQHQAISVIDGTQAAAHININVQDISCDFYTLSGHKMYAATGTGVLYGRYELLENLMPSKFGGEMISAVKWDVSDFQLPPLKFEGGTPNIAGALSLSAAMKFISQNRLAINSHELHLYDYMYGQLANISKLNMLGNLHESIALSSFTIAGMHTYDIAMALAQANVAVRAGHHCAMPLMNDLQIEGTVRVSIGCYNTIEEIDYFIQTLNKLLNDSLPPAQSQFKVEPPNEDHKAVSEHAELVALFKQSTSWNEKHRLLLLQSKQLPILDEAMRTDTNAVLGCEASVWVDLISLNNNKRIMAYSNSKVIRGLLSVLCSKVNGDLARNETSSVYTHERLSDYLHELGLPMYFSQGRRDGMQHVMERIVDLLVKK